MTEKMPITEYSDIEYTEFIPNNIGHVSRNTELKIVDLKTGQGLGLILLEKFGWKDPKYFRDISIMLRQQKRICISGT